MRTNKRLLEQLPFYDGRTGEFKEICGAEQVFFDSILQNNDDILREAFVESAEDMGLLRMENMLGLISNGISTRDRRANIIFKLMGDTPYTMSTLFKRLRTLCRGFFSLEYGEEPYTLKIKVGVGSIEQFEVIKKLLLRILPANISVDISVRYNSHGDVGRFRHCELAAMSHNKIRITNFS